MMDQVKNGYVLTTMTNPDGSTTVRRKVMNPDGSFTIEEEEYPSDEPAPVPVSRPRPIPVPQPEPEVDESPEVHLNDASDSVSSITDMKTSIISASSSKEDVFAGIEDSPLRPKAKAAEHISEVKTGPSPIHAENNMQTPLPPAYQSAMPRTSAFHNTPVIEEPSLKPNGTSGGIVPPAPAYDWNFTELRSKTLLDTPSVAQLDTPVTVTVFKRNLDDRIGINVGLSRVDYKDRLVVTKISETGLLSNSAIEEGDVIMSINSHSFLDDPHTEDALAIVTQTVGRITFEVQKRGNTGDTGGEEIENSSIRTTEEAIDGGGRVVTSEVLNGDGSLTIVVDQLDEYGERIHREIRRERHNAKADEIMRPPSGPNPVFRPREMPLPDEGNFPYDDFRFVEQPDTDTEPPHIHSGRSKKPPKEKRVVVRKTDKSEKLGIKLELHEGDKNILIVTGVHPSGLVAAAYTPLEVGDVIVSINGFDFMENASLEIANTIIRNSTGEITIYAVDGEGNLDGYSNQTSVTEPETPFSSSGDFRNEMTFDESSYGGSVGTYMASRIVRITKSDPSENVGLKLVQQRSHWGLMLVVLESSGKAIQSGINVGDAILAINGVGFRSRADPDRAALLLRAATNVVVIEFQRLAEMNAALPAPRNKKAARPGGDKRAPVLSTSVDHRISRTIDQFDATYATFQTTASPNAARPTMADSMTAKNDSHNSKRSTDLGQSKGRSSPQPSHQKPPGKNNVDVLKPRVVPPKPNAVVVRVQKESPDQDVGLKVEAINGVLYVSKISLQGLFVGKSIVPGDMILSINKQWFLDNPSVAEAEAIMRKAKHIVLEVKKGPVGSGDIDESKLKWHERIQCYKRTGGDD